MSNAVPKTGINGNMFRSKREDSSTVTQSIGNSTSSTPNEETPSARIVTNNKPHTTQEKEPCTHSNLDPKPKATKSKTIVNAKRILYEKLKWFLINLTVTVLCFLYCYFHDSSYKEMTSNWLFGEYEVERVNWLWWLLGIVMIVFGFKTITKYDEMKEAYKNNNTNIINR